MSDADGNYIPLTEDDQGEGIKDFHEPEETEIGIFQRQFGSMIENREKEEILNFRDRLDQIETDIQSIKHAIGDHVLIDGKWIDVTKNSMSSKK